MDNDNPAPPNMALELTASFVKDLAVVSTRLALVGIEYSFILEIDYLTAPPPPGAARR
jgi:hypothetical protein